MTTVERKADAQKIARFMVQKRLAGCVQVIGPMISTYWWKEKIEVAEEWLCIIKSHRDRYPEIEKAILEIHPYDLPEILAVPVTAGSKNYLEWLHNEIHPPSPDSGLDI